MIGGDIPQGTYSLGAEGPWVHPARHPAPALTHEAFCHAVRDLAVSRLTDDAPKGRLLAAKLVYGVGAGHYRGICYFQAWENGTQHDLIEIAATGEESALQLAGTTIHETGHVLAGPGAGHGQEWKDACFALGLRNVQAAGQVYQHDAFAPDVLARVQGLGEPNDGRPAFATLHNPGSPFTGLPVFKPGACPMGRGTRGGRMVQTARLRLWECGCVKPVKVRVASDAFQAHCDACGKAFHHVVK